MGTFKQYDERWFEKNKNASYTSGLVIAPLVLDFLLPQKVQSAIDVGCGAGGWLAAFQENGVETICGVDGQWVPTSQLLIPRECFEPIDLEKHLALNKKADIAICMEVAEHLPHESARSFIKGLTAIAPVILFSAAIPHQGGNNHVNEQWPEYWALFFKENGYIPIDCLRRKVWTDERVAYYYAQNAFLYVRKDTLHVYPKLEKEFLDGNATTLPLVHPYKFLSLFNPKPPFLSRVFWRLRMLLKHYGL